jgi:hypothetical protein
MRCPSREAIEDGLLDALLPALYEGSSRWSADRARAWLAFLATLLRRRGTRDLAWWELASCRAVNQIARALALGLAVGVLVGLLTTFAFRLPVGPPAVSPSDLWAGIQVGLAASIWTVLVAGIGSVGAIGLSLVGFAALRRPSRLALRLDRPFLQRFLIGAVVGLPVTIPIWLLLALQMRGGTDQFAIAVGPVTMAGPLIGGVGAVFALMLGLPIGLGLGLVFGLMRPSEQPPAPASSLGSNRMVTMITLIVASLSFVLATGGPSFGAGTAFGVVGGLPVALGMASVLPWSAYRLAHLWLLLRGRLPWRLQAFLEDAHRRGLLRQVGGVYQFRHARLQDRLAGP